MLIAHARRPFRGERKVIVAMGDMAGHLVVQGEAA
jgi:hypothetical protein